MKSKNTWLFLLVLLVSQNILLAQNPTTLSPIFKTLTPEQRAKDSLNYLNSMKSHPEMFLNKRLPVRLADGNYFVKGYAALGIRITNNHLVDSVYHNFHRGAMGSGIPPYSSMQVTDEKVSVDLFNLMTISGYSQDDSTYITPVKESIVNGNRVIDNKFLKDKDNGTVIEIGPNNSITSNTVGINQFKGDSIEIRISVNGKLLFDWTRLDKFTKRAFKSGQRTGFMPGKFYWFIGYSYGYHICDQHLKLNDQVLIEIKEDSKGWMLDRFNITRVAAQPAVSAIIPADKNNQPLHGNKAQVTIVQKKTSSSALRQGK